MEETRRDPRYLVAVATTSNFIFLALYSEFFPLDDIFPILPPQVLPSLPPCPPHGMISHTNSNYRYQVGSTLLKILEPKGHQ